MPRPLRIEFAGALYHLMARGDARAAIFREDADWQAFGGGLAGACERFQWRLCAYCLMDNRYHLLIETLASRLSRGKREVNGVYSPGFNRRHGWVGHVLQGRYKAVLVDKDSSLLELSRCIVLNPVRARLTGTLRRPSENTSGCTTPSSAESHEWIHGKTRPDPDVPRCLFMRTAAARS